MKGIFFFPPNWCNSHPYMSIPCIMPYLQQFDITACDLNAHYRVYQRSKRNLDKCYKRINEFVSQELSEKYNMIYEFLTEDGSKIEDILHDVRKFVNLEEYVFASMYEDELRLFQKVAYEKDGDLNSFRTISDVIGKIDDEDKNYYLDFYEDYFEKRDLNDISVVLVSLAGIQQIISALTLCRYIKRNYPHIKIIVGGNPFTKIINKIDQSWSVLFEKVFDYIMVFEGEYAVPDLLRCIENQGGVEAVPNCIHMKSGVVVKNKIDTRVVDIENGFLPEFSDYDLGAYNVPEVVLPYYVTRGCYWRKCTFCDHDFGYADCFRIKSIEKIVNDLCIYKEKYNVKYVHFVDEAIPPKVIEKMCHAILEKKLDIKWFTCIKASKQYTEELCRLMKEAGAVFVSIGVESCSQKVLNHMNKGISVEDIEITLLNMRKAHIWAHCFMINNFEGEDYKERWETFYFVHKYRNLFTSIGMGNFTLSRNAKIFDESGLSRECETMNAFSNDVFYNSQTALASQEADFLCNYYNNINFTSYFFDTYVFEREHLAFWIFEKQGFLNSIYMKKEYMAQISYNNKFLLKKIADGKMYIYSLMTKKFYSLPEQFEPIVELFDGNIEKLNGIPQMKLFANKENVISFLLDELYAQD